MAHGTTFSPTGSQERSGQDRGGDKMERARDKGEEAVKKGQEAIQKVGDKGAEVAEKGNEMLDKVREAGTEALGKAKEAAASVGSMATSAVTAAGQKVDDLTKGGGHSIRQLGERLDKQAGDTGIAAHATHAIADTLRTSGQYLEEHKLGDMAKDVGELVKAHPVPAMLVCFGLGFCFGRMMSHND